MGVTRFVLFSCFSLSLIWSDIGLRFEYCVFGMMTYGGLESRITDGDTDGYSGLMIFRFVTERGAD